MNRHYYINYNNGAAGHTILTHILYSCGQISNSLDNLFSPESNLHAVQKHLLLSCRHQDQYELNDDICLIDIKTEQWSEVLRLIFSYAKWHKQYPTISNYDSFFDLDKMNINYNKEWNDFYNSYKDPEWPSCANFTDVNTLPMWIQDEIHSVYQPPVTEVTDKNFVELLTIAYRDEFKMRSSNKDVSKYNGNVYCLSDYYFDRNVDVLKSAATKTLGWSWDDNKSNNMFDIVFEKNKKYLKELAKLQDVYYNSATIELLDWQVAILQAFKEFNEEKHYG